MRNTTTTITIIITIIITTTTTIIITTTITITIITTTTYTTITTTITTTSVKAMRRFQDMYPIFSAISPCPIRELACKWAFLFTFLFTLFQFSLLTYKKHQQ
ncbi:hypothetical protein E2C01_073742 [Portunus trituberculatus]|uniref:Uncharacterized protein n=1 Tax=Portunus trituberculatus TaxID=210409 RepID=A0A5B7IBE4_PORTR|nr:hypothetical protein [Portunus trituberculatus]